MCIRDRDIAAIPIIALVPLLGVLGGSDMMIDLLAVLKVVGVVAAVIVVGHFALLHLFRLVARTGIDEIFTATALLTVIGVALLMESIGLSMALGAFLAGEAVVVNEPAVDLVANRPANRLRAMAGVGDEHAAGKIQPYVTVRIVNLHTLGAIPHYRRLATHRDGLEITECF